MFGTIGYKIGRGWLKWIAALAGASTCAAGLYVYGLSNGIDRGKSMMQTEISRLEEERNKHQAALNDQIRRHAILQSDYERLSYEKQQVITKKVMQVVTRNVYRNVCIDDDGLSIANDAIKAANSD